MSKANKNNILTTNVLIIDSIGLLSNVYKYGDLAYIGGGFGSGIHNILEAVTFGLPVIFGPNYKKFNEAICLIKKKGAISISNYEELKIAINTFNNFDKNIALDYIKENSGAKKDITLDELKNQKPLCLLASKINMPADTETFIESILPCIGITI